MQKIIININDDKTEVEEHVLDGKMLIGSVLKDDGSTTVVVGSCSGGDCSMGIAAMLNNIFDVEPEILSAALLMHTLHCKGKGKGEETEDETALN